MKFKLIIGTIMVSVCGLTDIPFLDTTPKETQDKHWVLGPFVRPDGANPVISPQPTEFHCPMQKQPVKWEESDTFNPAATVKDGKIVVLYRAEDRSAQGIGKRTSRIGYAESKDGVAMTRLDAPVLFPADDEFADAYLMKGHSFFQLGNEESAMENYLQAEKFHLVSRSFINTFIGLNKASKGEWEEGYDYLEKAITAEDSYDLALPSLYANAALCLHKMGKKRKAHQYCKKAYNLAPEEIDSYLIEGRIYMEEGEYEKGVKKWTQALEYAPYADTWHEIGMCSMEIGQLSYAKLAFEHVKEMEPDFEGINERLTSLYMLLKDKENFMKYNQLCEHPFKLEELNRLQQILQEDNQEELALVMKNIFNALQ